MTTSDELLRGRAAYDRRAWAVAYDRLLAADRERPLDTEDLVRLATCAYLIGRDDESAAHWTRAHHAYLERAAREHAWREVDDVHGRDR